MRKKLNGRFRLLFKKSGIEVGIFIWLLLVCVITIPKIFAELQPVKSIEIFSEKLNYNKNEPGAFKITKSARWIEKGMAEIDFDVDTILKSDNKQRDILFVFDVSESMNGERIEKVKTDAIGVINNLLEDNQNRAGLITFSSSSKIVSTFTNKKEELIGKINNLTTTGSTNYYQAFINIDTILKNYKKEKNRECVVLFLTDGYPTDDSPNEVSQYNYLKNQYPFITINGIQYEMGDNILNFLGKISDKQYAANIENLSNVLQEAAFTSIKYDNFQISDFIDTDNFIVNDKDDIQVDKGVINFDKSSQKIEWSIPNLVSGTKANMTIKAKLKKKNDNGKYLTNSKEIISSDLGNISEEITSLKTPVLTDGYKVIYDGNAPSKCNVDVPKEKDYSVFDTVEIENSIPKCEGYEFKGWNINTKDIERVNNDYFVMPEEDVIIRGEWSKLDLRKSMKGTIQEKLTLYRQVQQDLNDNSKHAKKYTGPTSTFTGDNEVYYYERGAVNNNVIFAGYCWNIIRTTDTGGVKLLYSGIPTVDGRCANVPENANLTKEQMNTSSDRVAFSETYDSPAQFGYMYNTEYKTKSRAVTRKKVTVVNNYTTKPTTAFYYADSFTWDGTNYSLVNPEKLVWSDNYQNLVGKYTFGTSSNLSEKATVLYVVGAEENVLHYITLSAGSDATPDKTTITLSKTITNSSSGDYVLAEPIAVNKIDWYTNHEKYLGYYLCDGSTMTECSATMLKEILTTNDSSFNFYYVKRYGNSFTYEDGQYHLVDTVDTASLWNEDSLSNTHYTCFNSNGVCTTVSYVFSGDDEELFYINLSNGESIEDALYEMFRNPNVNKNDSQMKAAVDYWYQNNMTQYSDYLEDTVWCNDRRLRSDSEKISGWNPNGGKITENLYFKVTEAEHDLTCVDELDRFTVSSENGNGKLKYPVGLLTKKENNLVEEGTGDMPYIWGSSFGLMSPGYIFHNGLAFYISNSKEGYENTSGASVFVRPSVSLRAGIEYSSGDGSYDKPYVIDLSTYEGKIVVPSDSNVRANKPLALPGENITLTPRQSGYAVTSFKMNGKLIDGNSFVMPDGDAQITDVVVVEELVIESAHPYSNNLDDEIEHTFTGATSLNVKLEIQTENTSYDYVIIRDREGNQHGRYGGKTQVTENITIPGDYFKLQFHTDGSNYNYYGYKAIITPNYN